VGQRQQTAWQDRVSRVQAHRIQPNLSEIVKRPIRGTAARTDRGRQRPIPRRGGVLHYG